MQTIYCQRWNFGMVRPIDPLTVEQARRRDTTGKLYTVALGDPADPDVVLEITRPDIIVVNFFDKLGRKSVAYYWRRTEDNRMFLRTIRRWQYGDDSAWGLSEAELIEEVAYEPNGIVHHDIRDEKAHERRRVSYRDVPLDINWEPIPEFGDWASIARFERDKSPS
jgi:hypothetical protein